MIAEGEEDKDPLRMERAQGMVRQDAAIGEKTKMICFLNRKKKMTSKYSYVDQLYLR